MTEKYMFFLVYTFHLRRETSSLVGEPMAVEHFATHMGYLDVSDRMANSYSISKTAWKMTKRLFFHMLDRH
jgi:hypothetical protein